MSKVHATASLSLPAFNLNAAASFHFFHFFFTIANSDLVMQSRDFGYAKTKGKSANLCLRAYFPSAFF